MLADNSGQSSLTGGSALDGGVSGGEFMLFGVRVRVDPMRKSVSLNNLSQYELPNLESSNAVDVPASGYASADEAVVHHQPSGSRERKRGVPWTEEEHKLFLLGLQKVGKGDWRGISRNFVKTRTPTQVASHAQKYFLRRSNLNRRRRRSSLFDITAESVTAIPVDEKVQHGHKAKPLLSPAQVPLTETSVISGHQVLPFPVAVSLTPRPVHIDNPVEKLALGHDGPTKTRMVDLNLNQSLSDDLSPLSLNLSLSLDQVQDKLSRHSAFEVEQSFRNGDSMISVA